jgi:hypothetical protein
MRWVTELTPSTYDPDGHWPKVVRAVREWVLNDHIAKLAIAGAAFVFEGLRKL